MSFTLCPGMHVTVAESPHTIVKMEGQLLTVLEDNKLGISVEVKDISISASQFQKNVSLMTNERCLFKGFVFFLALSSTGEDGSTLQDAWLDRQKVGELIHEKGGQVSDTPQSLFTDQEKHSPLIPILLANRPLRTKKYLVSLSLGLPIVSIRWLQACIESNAILDYNAYRLSNGYSMLLDHWHVGTNLHCKNLFGGLSVHIPATTNGRLDWCDIMLCNKAQLCSYEECQYYLSDTKPKTLRVGIQLVTTEV